MGNVGNIDNQFVTVAVLKDLLWDFKEDIKDFVRSTAKSTETILRDEFRKEFASVRQEIAFTQGVIKAVNADLISRIEDVRAELKADMNAMEVRLTNMEVRLTNMEVRLTNMEVRLTDMEMRLTDKIEGVHAHIKAHESKPIHLAHSA